MLVAFKFSAFLVIPALPESYQLESLCECVIWTFQSWRWDYPVPVYIDKWHLTDPENTELYGSETRAILQAWKFLEPFFSTAECDC
jgi:hypothetical protein